MNVDDGSWQDDPGLYVERTGLAWWRTALAIVAVSFAMARLALLRDALPVGVLAVASGTVAGGALLHVSARRDGSSSGHPAPSGLPLAARLTVATTVVLAVTGVLVVLSG